METTAPKNKKVLLTVGAIILAAALFIVGFWAGNQTGVQTGTVEGAQAAEAKYKPIVNVAFPAPPTVMNKISGTVESVDQNAITLMVNDPNDYLPHLDGSPRATVTKKAIVTPNTTYLLVDYAKLDKNGAATLTNISLSDIKPGDTVTVTSDQNIRTDQTFGVNSVQVSKY